MKKKLLKKNLINCNLIKILEHRADLRIMAFGKTKEELFNNIMNGMFKGARYETEEREIKRKIEISSFDLSSLLVDFLNKILYLTETKKEVYQKINFKKFSDNEIKGILIGKKLKRIGVQIKAVTYCDLEIGQKENKTWEAKILFDI